VSHSLLLTTAVLATLALSGCGGDATSTTGPTPDTGVPPGTVLAVVSGNVSLNTPGAIYENKDVQGCITVNAPNVTIRRSRVRCNGGSAIWSGSTNLLIEDVEVDCGKAVGRTAITPGNYTARRVNAHGCDNTFWADRNVTIDASYIHDVIPYDPVLDPHTDGVQIPGGGSNVTIRRNRIYGGYINQSNFGNSAITMGGGTSNIIVDSNILAGGGYTLYCNQFGRGTNNAYTNNRFSTVFVPTVGGFGPWTECADENISGNVYHETGQAITP
jgi:hypothetical protein